MSEAQAKAKYLKYKAKYNALKAQQGGIISTKLGWFTYFMPKSVYESVKDQLNVKIKY